MKKMSLVSIIALGILISGCGSGNDSSGTGTSTATTNTGASTATVNTGVFIDSAVNGLEYSTLTQSGITDVNGTFKYLDGEEVEFKIGGIKLGKKLGRSVLSPLDLAGTDSPNNTRVQETLRLLQSLDEDSNASNGIKITEAIRNTANSMNEDLEANFDLSAALLNLGINNSRIVSSSEATKHFKDTLNQLKKPISADEFSIIEGVYQNNNTIMDINENGMITMYAYDADNHCINNANSTDEGYAMDGLFVTHESATKKFLVNVNGSKSGWNYSSNTLNNVFSGGLSAGGTINMTISGNKIFLSTAVSTEFTKNNLDENMCSVLGTSNQFKNIRGVYQIEDFVDSNATLQKQIRATVTHIDANATIHAYKVDSINSCLSEVVSGDYNFDINSKVLNTRNFEYTVDGNRNLKQYYALDRSSNRFSWLELKDGSIKYVGYKIGTKAPNVSVDSLNVNDVKILLTPIKSTTYTEDNISSNLCL